MKLPQLDRLGIPGVAALGLLLFCLSLYAGNIAPARNQLASLRSQVAQLASEAQPPGPDTGGPPDAKAGAPLPAFTTATEAQKELNRIAEQHGVTIDHASYQLNNKDGQLRLEISLPLKGGYSALRSFLLEVLALPAAPTLDEVLLQRSQATDPLIEANVRFSFYFAAPP